MDWKNNQNKLIEEKIQEVKTYFLHGMLEHLFTTYKELEILEFELEINSDMSEDEKDSYWLKIREELEINRGIKLL